ncbi:hypothetical protein MNBD_GAMMA03-776 [hydrothermal vent metagenome]|uniref:UPF0033 domain-containing protein n=1 Tax=hydrothermal vent metagenome TaxID=652676 RepID=A0A3B0VT35_9ZZZZ
MVKWLVEWFYKTVLRVHLSIEATLSRASLSLRESIVIIVDSKGFACPMPVIKLKKALTHHSDKGSVFLLSLTDEGGLKDIPAFCQQQQLEWVLLQKKPFIEFKVWRKDVL